MAKPETVYWEQLEAGGHSIYAGMTEQGLVDLGLGVEAFDDFAASVRKRVPNADLVHEPDRLADVTRQLLDYFSGNLQQFDIPLDLRGTAFQQAVWRAMLEIPYGCTCSYLDIARKLGKVSAVRAVGGACGANPVPVVVPCHRVVGKNGKLTGFSAIGGVALKQNMLKLEGIGLV